MLKSTLTRIGMSIAIALVAAVAAVSRPTDADASVTFLGDGMMMFVQYDCDNLGYSESVFNQSPQISYVRTLIWDHQAARWINNPGWHAYGNAFTISGRVQAGLGRGYFTFRPQVGRYVNGQWVTAWENDTTCCFLR
jgi:hypothetical protein